MASNAVHQSSTQFLMSNTVSTSATASYHYYNLKNLYALVYDTSVLHSLYFYGNSFELGYQALGAANTTDTTTACVNLDTHGFPNMTPLVTPFAMNDFYSFKELGVKTKKDAVAARVVFTPLIFSAIAVRVYKALVGKYTYA